LGLPERFCVARQVDDYRTHTTKTCVNWLRWLYMASSQSTEQQIIGQRLESAGNGRDKLEVRLSRELVSLLSEQLYSSPLKAIEELVVNAFDADASICRVQLPEVLGADADAPIVVFDDGVGMDVEGLRDLWHIGHSSKRDAEVEQRRKRTQIGKFGIGKLATYAIARHITYVTRTGGGPVLCATLDYEAFGENPTGGGDTVELDVVELDVGAMRADTELVQVLEEGRNRCRCALERRRALDDRALGALQAEGRRACARAPALGACHGYASPCRLRPRSRR
jgi:hypothetical protein